MPGCRPGRAKIQVLVLFVVLFAALFAVRLRPEQKEANPLFILDDPARYFLAERISLKNTGTSPLLLEASLFLPPVRTPSQEAGVTGFFPPPSRILQDEWGNRVAVCSLRIPPGERREIGANLSIRTWRQCLRLSSPRELRMMKLQALPDSEKKYLGAFPGIESEAPEIRKAAAAATAVEEEPTLQALLLYGYIVKNFRFNLHLAPKTALSALRSGVVQCADAALLYAALCRSKKIPARYVGGILYEKDEKRLRQTHAWNMVWTTAGGWFPVDPTTGRLDRKNYFHSFAELSNRYIQLWSTWLVPLRLNLARGQDQKNIRVSANFSITKLTAAAESRAALSSDAEARNLARLLPASGHPPTSVRAQKVFDSVRVRVLEARKLKKLEAIVPILENQYKNNPDPLNTYALALARILLNQYSRGAALIQELLDRGLDAPPVLNTLGSLYLETKAWGEAEKVLICALQKDPSRNHTWKNLIDLYMLEESWAKLEAAAGRASQYFPREAFFPGTEGYAMIRLGNWPQAREALKRAVELDPKMGWYHALLGWALLKSGNQTGGRTEIMIGLRLKTGISHPKFYQKMLLEMDKTRPSVR
ncbi:MAG: transglutaminase domain-containing protein [bacterium]